MSEEQIPQEVLCLLRFMCETWAVIDDWAYTIESEEISRYPIIQGLMNQVNIRKIANQEYDAKNIDAGIKWMLDNATE